MNRLCPQGHSYSGRKCTECTKHKSLEGTVRHYTHDWNMLSLRYRTHNPLCQDCDEQDVTTPASEVHHVIPLIEDPSLKLEWSNLRSLCGPCHRKTHRDMEREGR